MADILCRWLNDEVRLSKVVDRKSLAKDFSSGYLIGEVLHKYQLQNDFNMFMRKDTSGSKLNNFTRIEPTLRLLGISFDVATAQGLMQERQGVATHLLYQLYVSLEKKKKTQIGRAVMEIMQPAANAGLHRKEHEMYSDRLHQVVKRDTELKLQKISQQFEEKCQHLNIRTSASQPAQQKRQLKMDHRSAMNNEKVRLCRQRVSNFMAHQTVILRVPKPPPYTSLLKMKKRQQQQWQREQQAQMVKNDIAQFETNRKKLFSSVFPSLSSGHPLPEDYSLHGSNQGSEFPGRETKVVLQPNNKYLQEIRQRLLENAIACERREKRRDQFLAEQFKAREAQEEGQREELLVKRLTRQTQQEQRLTAQLLQIRRQKEVVRENRLFREQQHQQRRARDFQEALEREAALARQAKLDHAEEIRTELELCNRIAAERAQSRRHKHLTACKEILEQIVDLATKVGEHRLLTGNLVPVKLMREWKELLFSGLPLYEPINKEEPRLPLGLQRAPHPVDLKRQEILNNQDYNEYTSMTGEWAYPHEAGETSAPPTINSILRHVVLRLRHMVRPPSTQLPAPSFPHFVLKACVLGKFCSGKTVSLSRFAQARGVRVLSADKLMEEALHAHRSGEKVRKKAHRADRNGLLVPQKPDPVHHEESANTKSSARALLGEAAEKQLKAGGTVTDELLVDIVVEAIRQLPAESAWVLDGFPVNISQAHLLERSLGGSADAGSESVTQRVDLIMDPRSAKRPPPAPALDVVVVLDVSDECAARRALNQSGLSTGEVSAADDKVSAPVTDRIGAFQDTWSKLEGWFGGKQNILVRVDADVEEGELCDKVESVLREAMTHRPSALPGEDAVLDRSKSAVSSKSPVDQAPSVTSQDPGHKESSSSINQEKPGSVKSLSRSNPCSPRGLSLRTSACSLTNEDFQEAAENLPESLSPLPGSSSWVFVDEAVPQEMAENLCNHWDQVCESYVTNVRAVMQQLRSERSVTNQHLFNIREEYEHYLSRPDLKQDLVSQWQKDFNSVPDDMRDDEDTKAELHQRLDDLQECLWDISDKRAKENEKEMDVLMTDGWLEDHTAVLINHHSRLMQVELNRFQDTFCILRDYYLGMHRRELPEPLAHFTCIPLLDARGKEISSDPTASTGDSESQDKEDKTAKLIPLVHADPPVSTGADRSQDDTPPAKRLNEKLISDREEALTAISTLVSKEALLGELEPHQHVEILQEKEKEKREEKMKERVKERERAHSSASKRSKGKYAFKKQKAGRPAPPPAADPVPVVDERTRVRTKMHKEYSAALNEEVRAAKVRITLVKEHGLLLLNFLQSRAEKIFADMRKTTEARYLSEMKSIHQLTEVVRHHIESDAKLHNELVLQCNDFYLNGDCLFASGPPPPPRPRPPPLERPMASALTITQLQSLYHHLCNVAPAGFISSSEFFSLIRELMGRKVFPEAWSNMSETQLMEMVCLLTDDYELIDWRQFLLSAALPWPFPSVAQLLLVLRRFKAADAGNTGFVTQDQYLQTRLWFSSEERQAVPEDPSEPPPYDRPANLCKFFFQMFADHSVSPPRLDYVSMLLYFASDPSPKRGFVRALSLMVGRRLRRPCSGRLVMSLPSMEEAPDLGASDLVGEPEEEEDEDEDEEEEEASSGALEKQHVSIPVLLAVTCHKMSKFREGVHLPPGCMRNEEKKEHLLRIFTELSYEPEDAVPLSVLSRHPLARGLMDCPVHHQLVNIHSVLLAPG